jgi:hypothetical protein
MTDTSAAPPIAAAVVALALGIMSLLFAFMPMSALMQGQVPAGVAFLASFNSSLVPTMLFSMFLNMIINIVLIVGGALVLLRHPRGATTIRFGGWMLIGVVIAMMALTYLLLTSGTGWRQADAAERGAMIGGLIGGALAGVGEGVLLVFLARHRAPRVRRSA